MYKLTEKILMGLFVVVSVVVWVVVFFPNLLTG